MKSVRIEPISLGQFFLMVAVSVVAGGVYVWPSAVLEDAGLDAPWAIFVSVGLALGLVWLQTLWPPHVEGSSSLTRMQARDVSKASTEKFGWPPARLVPVSPRLISSSP